MHLPLALRPLSRPGAAFLLKCSQCRRLMTLAIETSCDDTSVAIVEKGVQRGQTVARLHFHKKVTSDNIVYQGVHPLISLQSHQENLANLVAEAATHLPHDASGRRLPDFVSVTRGPGMRSNLFTGLDTAKGLAVAWNRPLVGVHHMQAHALTPRLVAALEAYVPDAAGSEKPLENGPVPPTPSFPFLSVLASGGHTMLIDSSSVTSHRILGSTEDIAIGECLDKTARVTLPPDELKKAKSTMYGALLEDFVFFSERPNEFSLEPQPKVSGYSAREYIDAFGHRFMGYEAPENNEIALQRAMTTWGWKINQPLSRAGGGIRLKSLDMSFSGLMTAVERIVRYQPDPYANKILKVERKADLCVQERRDIARSVMRAAFEHLSSRVVLALQKSQQSPGSTQPAVVVAGGVASNSFLRHVLASTLCVHGFPDVTLYFPPPKYCTDNAAMIGWTGLEMFERGHIDQLGIRAIRKWPLDKLLSPVQDG